MHDWQHNHWLKLHSCIALHCKMMLIKEHTKVWEHVWTIRVVLHVMASNTYITLIANILWGNSRELYLVSTVKCFCSQDYSSYNSDACSRSFSSNFPLMSLRKTATTCAGQHIAECYVHSYILLDLRACRNNARDYNRIVHCTSTHSSLFFSSVAAFLFQCWVVHSALLWMFPNCFLMRIRAVDMWCSLIRMLHLHPHWILW